MGRKTGITSGSYHPKIWKMHYVMGQREFLREQEYLMDAKKKLRQSYWKQREANAIDVLLHIDLKNGAEWYEDNNNVPAFGSIRERVQLAEKRVIELTGSFPKIKARIYRGIFVWQDPLGVFLYSKEVGKETLYVIEFETLDAAHDFINGLPSLNRGYGVVLDILPASALVSVKA